MAGGLPLAGGFGVALAMRKAFALTALAMVMVGCGTKGVESFHAATTTNPEPTWGGDKYANGGNANATGGLNTKTRYTEGAKLDATPAGTEGAINTPRKGIEQKPEDITPATKSNSPAESAKQGQ